MTDKTIHPILAEESSLPKANYTGPGLNDRVDCLITGLNKGSHEKATSSFSGVVQKISSGFREATLRLTESVSLTILMASIEGRVPRGSS
ncbi:MAG: hypothetical protein ACYC9S_08640 [Leptospirales bacterium]